jgi:group I intron endonuclease
MKTGLIYLITNTVNGKVYVGQTNRSLKKRWQAHCKAAQAGEPWALARAIRKYGKEAFTIAVLEAAAVEDLGAAEIKWIEHYESFTDRSKGYNLTAGGEGGIRGYKHSEESKRLMAEANKGAKHYNFGGTILETTKQALTKALLGVPKSEEHRKNMSLAQKGHKVSDAARESTRLRNKGNKYRLGKTHSEATKQQIREAKTGVKAPPGAAVKRKASMEARGGWPRKGVTVSDETKEKMRNAKLGKKRPPRSPEHSEKIRQNKLAYWANKRAQAA